MNTAEIEITAEIVTVDHSGRTFTFTPNLPYTWDVIVDGDAFTVESYRNADRQMRYALHTNPAGETGTTLAYKIESFDEIAAILHEIAA